MDGLKLKTNSDFDRTVRNWLTQYFIEKEPDIHYREALMAALYALWPAQKEGPANKGKPSYFPLPCLCGQALGLCTATTIAVNAAWALLFLASFLLDKVEDHEVDHSVFLKFNEGEVANLATGLILHAERILIELEPDPQIDKAGLVAVRRVFNQKALEVCAGQHLDLTLAEPSFGQVWEIVDGKSGKFFELAAFLGSRLVTADVASLEAFSQVGRHLGILNQIANDINGLGRDYDIGCDLAQGKRTLPVLYALEVLPMEERARLVEQLKAAPTQKDAEIEARRRIISAGVIVYLSLEAEKHRQQAVNSLVQLKLSPEVTQPLIDLLNFASHAKTSLEGVLPEQYQCHPYL